MDIRLHENGWTVLVENFDLNDITQDQVNILAKYLLTNEVILFKKQNLTPEKQVKICQMFGDVRNFNDLINDHSAGCVLKDGDGNIIRVTGALDEHGRPGLFGHVHELEWHCNRVSEPDRKSIIWLYGAEGTKGSRTSWINHILTYQDLPEETKEKIKDYKLDVGSTVQFTGYLYGDDYVPAPIEHYKPPMVYTNQLGITGLFFSWNQIHFIEGLEKQQGRELIEELRQFCEQEKYMYHHDWEDGDLVISEQWLSIHKRWEFEHMDKRVLHRIAMDFSNIDIEKLKTL